jgi:hypothetical protein
MNQPRDKREGDDGYDPWVKLRADWYTRRQHTGLSVLALHVGAWLLSQAKASPEPGVLLRESGQPHTALTLARGARLEGSAARSSATMAAILGELEDAGTLVHRQDGAWSFGGYWRASQQSDSKERTAAWRARKAAAEATTSDSRQRHDDRHGDAPGDASVTSRSREDPKSLPPEDKDNFRTAAPCDAVETAELADPETARAAAEEARRQTRERLGLTPRAGEDRGLTRIEYDDDGLGGQLRVALPEAAHRRVPRVARIRSRHLGQAQLWPDNDTSCAALALTRRPHR